ncbi:MAG: tetratricopeptide repeat protein, partial [Pyrinomonadaceae bacterium]
NLSFIGVNLSQSGNDVHNAEAINYSKKALELIEAGKTPEGMTNFNKDQAIGQLNIALGRFSLKANAFEDAVKYFTKATEKDPASKQDPATYFFIGQAYAGAYEPVADKLKAFVGKPETDESKALQARLDQISDVMIDAFARTVSYSGTDPKHTQVKNIANEQLTVLYKARHEEKTDGLNELVSGITSKPLPVLSPPSATPPPSTTAPAGTNTTPQAPVTPQSQPSSNGTAKPNSVARAVARASRP